MVLSMLQTSIFEPDDISYEGESHTDQETYKALEVVNTKNLLLDECPMIKLHYCPK